jgi:DNA-binding protein H-NS
MLERPINDAIEVQIMRQPRDYDSELKALNDKGKQLKERKVQQLGELVSVTGADRLDAQALVGALLAIAEVNSPSEIEGRRARGLAFFQGKRR